MTAATDRASGQSRPARAVSNRVFRRLVAGYVVAGACASLLAGCARYRAKPLPPGPDLSPMPKLTLPASRLDLPGLKPQSLNPAKGLSETAIIMLAVLNDPALKAQRLKAGVASAQLLNAGLIPDLTLDGSVARSAKFRGYDAALAEDLRALVTRRAAKNAAAAHAKQVDLQVLWQEWQVAQRARELFIQAVEDEQLREVVARRRTLLADLYDRDQTALRQRNLTATALTADLSSLTDAETQLRALQIDANQTRHGLDELLALEPDVPLRLNPAAPATPPLSAERFRAAVMQLPRRRADLLALQAGYRSQEANLRRAILGRFPLISAGVEKSRGAEEGVPAQGVPVSLTLPFFNRNRGEIAIQRATRDQLYAAYQARLDQAENEADQTWKATQITARQLSAMNTRLPVLEQAAAAARKSYEQGLLDIGSYVRVESNALSARADAIRLRASLEQAQAALATLLALPF